MSRTKKFAVTFLSFLLAVFSGWGIWTLTVSAEGETAASVKSVTTNTMGNASYPLVISANTDVSVSLGNNADLKAEATEKAKVTLTRGSTTLTATIVRGYEQAILGWFQSSNGVTLAVNTPVRGDLFEIVADFTFKASNESVTYKLASAIEYIYDGSAWISGHELPDAPVEVTVSSVESVATPYDAFPIRLDIATNASGLGGGAEDLKFTAGTDTKVTYTRGDKSVKAGAFHGDGANIRAYFKGSADLPLEKDTPIKGDILTLGAGFGFTSKDGSVSYLVEEDIKYVYTGAFWYAGTTLPTGAEVSAVENLAPKYPNNYQMNVVISTNAAALGSSGDLKYPNGAGAYVTYTRGGESVAAGAFHAEQNTKIIAYFKNSTEVSFGNGTPIAGDILTLREGFTFYNSAKTTTYTTYEDIKYIYTTSCAWTEYIPATALAVASENLTVEAEKTLQIRVTLTPANSTEVVKYTSLDAEKATVSATGLVTGVAEGEVQIKVTAGAFEQNVTVTVTPAQIEYVKTGIKVTSGATQTIYSGRDYVKPSVAYVYTPEKETEEPVDADKVVVDETGYDKMTAKADGYTLTVKVLKDGSTTEYYTATFTVIVNASTQLTINSMTTKDVVNNTNNDSPFFVNTDSKSTKVDDANQATLLQYVEFMFPDGTKGNVWFARVNKSVARFFVRKKGSTTANINKGEIPVGAILTVKEGFGLLESEYLRADVSYVFNGVDFEPLVEPTSITVTAERTQMYVGSVLQVNVQAANEGVNVVYRYAVNNTDVAEINSAGLITAKAAGTIRVTVSYKDISNQELNITVVVPPTEKVFEVTSQVKEYWVPVSTTENPTSFTRQGYALKGRYVFEDGSESAEFAIEESQLGAVDYTKAGSYSMTVSDKNSSQTDTVAVVVYEYAEVNAFDTIGVSGYDVNDSRNKTGTWNGHMIISMKSYSTNGVNLLSTDECGEMAKYIRYETAGGKTYSGDGTDKRIGLWELSSNLLVMIKPDGATGNVGYGSESEWKQDATYAYAPVYQAGDKIIFKSGMPIYAWKGDKTADNKPDYDKGCMIVEGFLTEDWVYYCYEEDGTKSLWQLYKEYTDFSVSDTMTVTVGGTASLGAARIPSDATTGAFSYMSSDETVLTVTGQGNVIGVKAGTAIVTVTLSGGKNEDGTAKADIVKTVTITVKRGISKIEGSFEIEAGAAFDASQYEVTVTFSDGTTEKIKLDDARVTMQEVDTSTVGETIYNVSVTIDGETRRGTITVNVVKGGGCKSSCGSSLTGGGIAIAGAVSLISAALCVSKKKKEL